MSRWTQDLVYFVYRSLIKSSDFNTNFSLVRGFFEALEADFDALTESLAGVIGNCIVAGGNVTVKSGMTVSIDGLFAFTGGKGVSLPAGDYTVPKPASGTCTVACVVDSGQAAPGISFLLGSTSTPTVPPTLNEYQTVVFTSQVSAGQGSLTQGAVSYSYRVDAADIVEEIDAARVSSLLGAFASLDARLEAIEEKLAKVCRLTDGLLSVPQLASAPIVGSEDRVAYFDTTIGKARFWDGLVWNDLY